MAFIHDLTQTIHFTEKRDHPIIMSGVAKSNLRQTLCRKIHTALVELINDSVSEQNITLFSYVRLNEQETEK